MFDKNESKLKKRKKQQWQKDSHALIKYRTRGKRKRLQKKKSASLAPQNESHVAK